MSRQYDLAVVGSGFAGTLLAVIAHQLGRSVVLLERGKHPRFAIGESSTPLSNLLLEELTTQYDLPALKPLAKWGSWQTVYPDVGCGLKRGFTFYHHGLGMPAAADPERQAQLLVAASPHDEIADTHWYRPAVDHLFVQKAQALGVEYLDEVHLAEMQQNPAGVNLLGTRKGDAVSFRAKFVVDATGPRGFLHRALALKEVDLPSFPKTQALYSHFTAVRRIEELGTDPCRQRPYPVDDAAVHHVFDGGWIWVLRFNNGITSAGVAATDDLAEHLQFKDGAPAWDRLLALLPTLQRQFVHAKAELPFTHMPRLSFRSSVVVGKRWALLPSAAGFVDPLLSTGFPLTLLGVSRLAAILEQDWESDGMTARLENYGIYTENELLATSQLIAALYASMGNFPKFVSLSMLYFAAASFSEAARRLGKPHLATSFLLHDQPTFGPAFRKCLENASEGNSSDELAQQVSQAIESFNVAGLGDPRRRNWYPVDAEDLIQSAWKLGATPEEALQLLRRSGFHL